MATQTRTKSQVKTIVLSVLGVAAVAGIAVFTINPNMRKYLTQPFSPYRIIPGYITPGYVPGYRAPGTIPGYRAPTLDPRRFPVGR